MGGESPKFTNAAVKFTRTHLELTVRLLDSGGRTPTDKKEKKAVATKATSKSSRRVIATAEERAVAKAATELAPSMKSPILAPHARRLLNLLGDADPVEFAGLPARSGRKVLALYADGKLDPAHSAYAPLTQRFREISALAAADGSGSHANLWGRRTAALLAAVAVVRADTAKPAQS